MTQLLMPVPATDRVGRYPRHIFQIREQTFAAQPFMLAPVLPGETLTNLYFESRVITDPILNPIIGWKKEYYFFYVKISDLLTTAIRDMFVDPTNTDLTATLGAASNVVDFYQPKGGIDYVARCLEAIMEHYFRDEGEAWNLVTTTGGIPMVQIRDTLFLDSLTDKDEFPEGAAISGATDAGDLDRLMDAYEQLRAIGMTNLTYADFLRMYGINVPDELDNKPELLYRFSDFQYPSNTIDPTSGAPTSAVSWVFKNGSPKNEKKFFKEPGFIVGISITRPKVYYAGLSGSAAAFMGRAWDWMPAYLAAMPETSLKNFAADTGPLGDRASATDPYWLDMRDLLLYGDQFQNMVGFDDGLDAAGNAAHHLLPLPVNSSNIWNIKNPTEAMAKSFFVDSGGSAYHVRSDGYVSLSIQGTQVDHTRGGVYAWQQ